jgi:ribosomal protein L34E
MQRAIVPQVISHMVYSCTSLFLQRLACVIASTRNLVRLACITHKVGRLDVFLKCRTCCSPVRGLQALYTKNFTRITTNQQRCYEGWYCTKLSAELRTTTRREGLMGSNPLGSMLAGNDSCNIQPLQESASIPALHEQRINAAGRHGMIEFDVSQGLKLWESRPWHGLHQQTNLSGCPCCNCKVSTTV